MDLFAAHNQWATRPPDERYRSLTGLAAAVHARRGATDEHGHAVLSNVDVAVDHQGNLVFGGRRPTHWSFGQIASLVGAPAGYLRDLPVDLAARNLSHGFRQRFQSETREGPAYLKLLVGYGSGDNPDGPATLRAVTSERYERLWDAEVVRALQEHADGFTNPVAFENGVWGAPKVPSGLYASDHDVFAFMVNDDDRIEVGGDQLGRGFYVWNSETGGKTFGFATFLYRYVCGNHIIWGAKDVATVRLRHVGKGIREAIPRFIAAIEQLRSRGGKLAEEQKIRAAMADQLAATVEEATEVLQKSGFTRTEATHGVDFAVREEPSNPLSRWGLVNGLTAYARTFEYIDDRVALEERTGRLLAQGS